MENKINHPRHFAFILTENHLGPRLYKKEEHFKEKNENIRLAYVIERICSDNFSFDDKNYSDLLYKGE